LGAPGGADRGSTPVRGWAAIAEWRCPQVPVGYRAFV